MVYFRYDSDSPVLVARLEIGQQLKKFNIFQIEHDLHPHP